MKKLTLACSTLILCFLFFAACKKSSDNNNNNKFTGCELVKILDSSDAEGIKTTTNISYNESGNMIGATTTGTTAISRSVDYTNSFPVVHISGNNVAETDTITLAGSLVSMIAAHYYTSPWTGKSSYFTYDASGQLQQRKDLYSNGTSVIYNYTWANGDMISETSGTDSYTYTYDTTITSQDGDWMRENQVVTQGLGKTYINTKHAIASRTHNMDAPVYFFYQKDANGRIGICSSYTGSSLEVYTYSYYCTQ